MKQEVMLSILKFVDLNWYKFGVMSVSTPAEV
jgi:hypothetical protein